ncbi:hypothetical protein V6N11_053497 [Hibiscus sabdariffa]|uniref:Uncharacterized protein n=1 Tax=Hibiscus sabdariffa TaxID=183260 RepID=A0ABR2UD69_9ROSI
MKDPALLQSQQLMSAKCLTMNLYMLGATETILLGVILHSICRDAIHLDRARNRNLLDIRFGILQLNGGVIWICMPSRCALDGFEMKNADIRADLLAVAWSLTYIQ